MAGPLTGGPVDGDFDTDGDVDGADFLNWQLGQPPNSLDLTKWQENFGAEGGGGGVAGTAGILNEAKFFGFSTLVSGSSLDLGTAYDTSMENWHP